MAIWLLYHDISFPINLLIVKPIGVTINKFMGEGMS